jgi:hypothetical protein
MAVKQKVKRRPRHNPEVSEIIATKKKYKEEARQRQCHEEKSETKSRDNGTTKF